MKFNNYVIKHRSFTPTFGSASEKFVCFTIVYKTENFLTSRPVVDFLRVFPFISSPIQLRGTFWLHHFKNLSDENREENVILEFLNIKTELYSIPNVAFADTFYLLRRNSSTALTKSKSSLWTVVVAVVVVVMVEVVVIVVVWKRFHELNFEYLTRADIFNLCFKNG